MLQIQQQQQPFCICATHTQQHDNVVAYTSQNPCMKNKTEKEPLFWQTKPQWNVNMVPQATQHQPSAIPEQL